MGVSTTGAVTVGVGGVTVATAEDTAGVLLTAALAAGSTGVATGN